MSPAPRCHSTSGCSRRPGSSETVERARATTTAPRATRSPSCASTSRASGKTRSPPSRKPPRKESRMSQQTSERVVEKSVTVNVPIDRAFEVFTAEIATWWPLRTHAVDTERSETVVMESHVGGRLYERTPSGEEHVWGTLVAWEPPSRIVYSWHPGRGVETAQEVEVTFSAEGAGTR